MARARRRLSRRLAPREPRGAQRAYMAGLVRVWQVVQEIATTGLAPLLDVWPAEEPRADAVLPEGVPRQPSRVAVTQYPLRGSRTRPRQYVNPGPFGTPSRRRISDLTDADLRRLWPGLDPQDVRRYAPWATSREEVYRIAFPAGTPIREGEAAVFELQPRVKAAIDAERRISPRPRPDVEVRGIPQTRPTWAFRPRYPVYDRAGNILLPPRPDVVSAVTIQRQMAWIRVATHEVVTTTNLGPIIDPASRQTSLFASRESRRILGIDIREHDPSIRPLINAWRELNVNLVESGLMAGAEPTKLRPGLLPDLSRVIEDAHRRGIRVEALAGQLEQRFDISKRRAQLIARDQILKLNARVNQHLQQRVGVREYTWSTSRDERVREMHAELEGTTQSYTNPPEVAPGRYGNPGDDYQCRCVAIPIMPPREPAPE